MTKNHQYNYNVTKQILLGKQSIRPDFKPFAEWFEKTYNAEIANIMFDLAVLPNHPVKTPIPSLEITFKYIKDSNKFHNGNISNSDFERKQVIFKKFVAILTEQGLSQEDVFSELYNAPKSAENIEEHFSVAFECFEYREKSYVQKAIPKAKIDELLDRINNEDIWKISNDYSGTKFILYTEIQVAKYRGTEEHEKWKNLFFELIQEYNQLVFFKLDDLFISLESKERIDEANDSELSNYR